VQFLPVLPCLKLEITNRLTAVVVAHFHSPFIGLIVDRLSAQEPLLLLTESLKNVIGAHLHDANFVIDTGISSVCLFANLVLADLLITTTGDEARSKSHKLAGLHVRLTHGTLFVTESLGLSVWVPLIMGLVVSMVLVKGVVKISIEPV